MKRLITRLALSCLLCLPVLAASRVYIHTEDADWDGYVHAALVRVKVAATAFREAEQYLTREVANAAGDKR